jgi:hypothetical protein
MASTMVSMRSSVITTSAARRGAGAALAHGKPTLARRMAGASLTMAAQCPAPKGRTMRTFCEA